MTGPIPLPAPEPDAVALFDGVCRRANRLNLGKRTTDDRLRRLHGMLIRHAHSDGPYDRCERRRANAAACLELADFLQMQPGRPDAAAT